MTNVTREIIWCNFNLLVTSKIADSSPEIQAKSSNLLKVRSHARKQVSSFCPTLGQFNLSEDRVQFSGKMHYLYKILEKVKQLDGGWMSQCLHPWIGWFVPPPPGLVDLFPHPLDWLTCSLTPWIGWLVPPPPWIGWFVPPPPGLIDLFTDPGD